MNTLFSEECQTDGSMTTLLNQAVIIQYHHKPEIPTDTSLFGIDDGSKNSNGEFLDVPIFNLYDHYRNPYHARDKIYCPICRCMCNTPDSFYWTKCSYCGVPLQVFGNALYAHTGVKVINYRYVRKNWGEKIRPKSTSFRFSDEPSTELLKPEWRWPK